MAPDEIPQEWLDILDKQAGKKHSRDGYVALCLAEILTLASAAERERLRKAAGDFYGPGFAAKLVEMLSTLDREGG